MRLDAGADDYLIHPLECGEMLARARAVLRRALQVEAGQAGEVFRLGALEVDFAAREVRRQGHS